MAASDVKGKAGLENGGHGATRWSAFLRCLCLGSYGVYDLGSVIGDACMFFVSVAVEEPALAASPKYLTEPASSREAQLLKTNSEKRAQHEEGTML